MGDSEFFCSTFCDPCHGSKTSLFALIWIWVDDCHWYLLVRFFHISTHSRKIVSSQLNLDRELRSFKAVPLAELIKLRASLALAGQYCRRK